MLLAGCMFYLSSYLRNSQISLYLGLYECRKRYSIKERAKARLHSGIVLGPTRLQLVRHGPCSSYDYRKQESVAHFKVLLVGCV